MEYEDLFLLLFWLSLFLDKLLEISSSDQSFYIIF
jgi:hypothetical protein